MLPTLPEESLEGIKPREDLKKIQVSQLQTLNFCLVFGK